MLIGASGSAMPCHPMQRRHRRHNGKNAAAGVVRRKLHASALPIWVRPIGVGMSVDQMPQQEEL